MAALKENESEKPYKSQSHAVLNHRTSGAVDSHIPIPPLPVQKWSDNPLMMCTHTSHCHYIHSSHDREIAIPINKLFDFESLSFKGQCIVRVTDMPTTEKWYFKKRNRKMAIAVQGQFRRKIRYDKIYTGQSFEDSLRKFPGQYVASGVIKLIKQLSPGFKCEIDGPNPHFISSMASAAQIINISEPGHQKPLPLESSENLSLLDKRFKGMDIPTRKAIMSNDDELQKYFFEPGLVYTMEFYSHMISPRSYTLHMLGMKVGIQKYVPGPMQLMAVIVDDDDRSVQDYRDRQSVESIHSEKKKNQ